MGREQALFDTAVKAMQSGAGSVHEKAVSWCFDRAEAMLNEFDKRREE
jgi:hypothetical protein